MFTERLVLRSDLLERDGVVVHDELHQTLGVQNTHHIREILQTHANTFMRNTHTHTVEGVCAYMHVLVTEGLHQTTCDGIHLLFGEQTSAYLEVQCSCREQSSMHAYKLT